MATTDPVLGYRSEDVTFVQERDADVFNECYPKYNFRGMDRTSTLSTEDSDFGDIEHKRWNASVAIPIIIRNVEQDGETKDANLEASRLSLEAIFSEKILSDNSLDPQDGDLIDYSDGNEYELIFVRKTDPIGNTGTFLHRYARLVKSNEKRTYEENPDPGKDVITTTGESDTVSMEITIGGGI